jgi:eukaryotic-like serine/threonine-protein kinase
MSLKKQGKYRFNEFEIDLSHRTLRRDGRAISVGLRTFDLLAYFVLNAQRVVGNRELIDALWPDSRAEESDLSQQVLLLRRALTSTRSGDKLVMTIPSGGYMFTPRVREAGEDVSDPVPASAMRPSARRFQAASGVAVEEPAEAVNAEPDSGSASGSEDEEDSESERRLVPEKRAVPERPIVPDRAVPDRALVQRRLRDRKAEEREAKAEAAEERAADDFEAPARPRWLWIAAAVLLLAFIVVGSWISWQRTHRVAADSLSLVMGEFTNNSGEPLFDYSLQMAATIALRQSPFMRLPGVRENWEAFSSIKSAAGTHAGAAIGRQVCKRLNGQAYLNGDVHRLGRKFLISIEAFDCDSGRSRARSIGIADTADGALVVLDKVSADMRRQLGESPESIAKFNKPLFAGREGSLEAFKAYSDGELLSEYGKYDEAALQLQRAIEIDHEFTLAYAELGVVSIQQGDEEMARTLLTRAHDLRDTVDEYDRLMIVAAYDNLVTGDLQSSIRNQKEGMALYPRNPSFPASLANLEMRIGNAAMAIEPAQKALSLNPGNGAAYVDLARAQLSLGQFEEAGKTCQKAMDKGLDSAEIHGLLLQIAYLLLDQPAMDEQIAWERKQIPGSSEAMYMQLQQALMAFAEGKIRVAQASFSALSEGYRSRGEYAPADAVMEPLPRMNAELGLLAAAQTILAKLPAANAAASAAGSSDANVDGVADLAVAWAEIGETSRAEAILKREVDAHPLGTLWQAYAGPQIRASVDLNQGHPDGAVQALQSSSPYDLRSFDLPALRGRAYLAAKQPALAEAEFHKILDHPGIEPFSYNFPLARLGLARALAAQGKVVDASLAYKVVFAIWKDADPDLPRLKAAHEEYAKLNSVAPKAKASPVAHVGVGAFKPGTAKPPAVRH